MTQCHGEAPIATGPTWAMVEHLQRKIERLRAAISRIDAINDNPSCFNAEINAVCDTVLRPHLNEQIRSET